MVRGINMSNFVDKHFDKINVLFVSLITLIILYPLVFVASASISNPVAVNTGQMWLWPVDITFEGFKRVFSNNELWRGYRNTLFYTTVSTLLHLAVLLPGAYALSRKEIFGKRFLNMFILITMLVSGGMIPSYLLINNLGMLNTIWAIIIPGLIGAWNIFVTRTFFEQAIPEQLIESATIDGASEVQIFAKIVLPLSLPIIAVMALFKAVGMWNEYFSALIYLRDSNLFPLQLILREILVLNQFSADALQTSGQDVAMSMVEMVNNAELIKYAAMIVSSVPLLIAYPFVQRYFVKGTLIGSVKE